MLTTLLFFSLEKKVEEVKQKLSETADSTSKVKDVKAALDGLQLGSGELKRYVYDLTLAHLLSCV